MGEDNDYFPRVTIETSKSKATLSVNFKVSTSGVSDTPPGLKELFATLEDWTAHCIAAISHMPFFSSVGHYAVEKRVQQNLIDHLKLESISHEELILDEDDERKRYSFILHEDDVSYVAQSLSETTHLIKAARAIQRSNLSAIIAEFDFLIFRSLTAIAKDHPEIFVSDDEQIKAGYLRSGKTFEDWQSEKSAKTIEKKLRESHKDVVDWVLDEVANLKDPQKVKKNKYYRDFLEVCQRRHLFIHNGGTVNEDYRRKCLDAGLPKADLPENGVLLEVDPKYLTRAAARVYLVGAFTMFIVAQNVYPRHKSVAHRMMLSASHEFLQAGLTKMAERIIDFAEFNSGDFSNDLKLKFAINKALSKLLDPSKDTSEQTENAEKVLEQYDWSVTTPIFDLALACAKRDFSNLLELAEAAQKAGLSYRDVRSFVVFREAVEIEGFMDCFPKANLLIEDKTQQA